MFVVNYVNFFNAFNARAVARKWDIEGKTTTIGTDSARNMVAAIQLARYKHMNCVAHMVQRSVTVSLADSGFVNALAKARKVSVIFSVWNNGV